MSVIIGSTEIKYDTSITNITIDDINYKYIYNNNIQFITSTEQNQEIIDYINAIVFSFKSINAIRQDVVYKDLNIKSLVFLHFVTLWFM